MKKQSKEKYSSNDLEFVQSLGAAVLEQAPRRLHIVLIFWVITIVLLLIWMSVAEVDEITRGQGEVVPSGENQVIQNLEGGIIEEILVQPGDQVKQGQLLLKIDNQKSTSGFESSQMSAQSLRARARRLRAEANGEEFALSSSELEKISPQVREFIETERSLYESRQYKFQATLEILNQQLKQRQLELKSAKSQAAHLKASRDLIQQEVEMTEPLVKKGVEPEIKFLGLKREANNIEREYQAVLLSVPRYESAVEELRQKIEEHRYLFVAEAKQQLNDTIAQLNRAENSTTALADQVRRTLVRSPANGIVQRLFVHTVGGVIKPGENLLELVPIDDTLLIEARVKPADIAFIYIGQPATVKFSAYDYSIYGGLEGKVVQVSADTIKDERGAIFYTIRILTDKNYLGSDDNPLEIIPGMTTTVNIITGKKTVMDYILKPILKTKTYTFSER